MALTEKSIINRVRELTGLGESALPRPRILSLMNDARVELARRKPYLLRKTYSALTCTNGVAALTTALSNTDPICTDLLSTADIFASGITPKLQYVPDLSLLNEERPAAFGFFTLVGTELRVRQDNADYTGTLAVTATCIPALSTITRLELEQLYIQIIAQWVLGTELEKTKAVAARVTTG